MEDSRETLPLRCAKCGFGRTILAYRPSNVGAELTCLDTEGCERRQQEAKCE